MSVVNLTKLTKRSGFVSIGPVIVLVLIFITLRAISFWQQLDNQQNPVSVQSIAPAIELTQRSPAELVNLHLFGRPVAPVDSPPEIEEDLPETHLQLTLRGVSTVNREHRDSGNPDLKDSEEHVGGALIEGPDRATEFFRIGSTLPGNAKLHAVFTNRIVLDRNGKLENLSFPTDWTKAGGIASFESLLDERESFEQDQDFNQDFNQEYNAPEEQQGNSADTEDMTERLAIQARLFEERVMLGQAESAEEFAADSANETDQEDVKSRLQQLRDLIQQQRTQ